LIASLLFVFSCVGYLIRDQRNT